MTALQGLWTARKKLPPGVALRSALGPPSAQRRLRLLHHAPGRQQIVAPQQLPSGIRGHTSGTVGPVNLTQTGRARCKAASMLTAVRAPGDVDGEVYRPTKIVW